MAKRTGLGRGIGALIPTGDSAEARPVDVFFPGASSAAAAAATVESRDAQVSDVAASDAAASAG
jgi:ParB family chromosome partitioning protein